MKKLKKIMYLLTIGLLFTLLGCGSTDTTKETPTSTPTSTSTSASETASSATPANASDASPSAAQTSTTAPTPPTPTTTTNNSANTSQTDWNTSELDITKNGNMLVAITTLKSAGNIKNKAQAPAPNLVFKSLGNITENQ